MLGEDFREASLGYHIFLFSPSPFLITYARFKIENRIDPKPLTIAGRDCRVICPLIPRTRHLELIHRRELALSLSKGRLGGETRILTSTSGPLSPASRRCGNPTSGCPGSMTSAQQDYSGAIIPNLGLMPWIAATTKAD